MSRLYLAAIKKEGSIEGQSNDLNPVEIKFIDFISTHPDQGRTNILINLTLCAVARDYVERMAREGFEGHTDPQGFGPNHRVRASGYPLPDYYSKEDGANNVESLMWGGGADPAGSWAAWLTSIPHKTHLLGLNSFYSQQNCIGMGFYQDPNSLRKFYYCFLSALCP